jgi:molybdopterin-guanine dinucleotide biosynthesis protein A
VQDITAFIIAGGKSTRMGKGTDKAFLMLDGKALVEHMISKAKSVADDVLIVGPKEKFSAYGRVVEDIYKDCGPLGGIHAALNRSRTELNVVVPVDTPFLDTAFLSYIVDEARKNTTLVTVPKLNDGLQPLCAVYRRGFAIIAEESLAKGKYKIDTLFTPEIVCVLDLNGDAMKRRGFDAAMFDNINTAKDYEGAAKRVSPKSRVKNYS